MIQTMITTTDNPYDPFDEYEEWYNYDERMGYHTTSLLAMLVVTSDELAEPDQLLALDLAIEEMVEENVTGLYKKVTREITEEQITL